MTSFFVILSYLMKMIFNAKDKSRCFHNAKSNFLFSSNLDIKPRQTTRGAYLVSNLQFVKFANFEVMVSQNNIKTVYN